MSLAWIIVVSLAGVLVVAILGLFAWVFKKGVFEDNFEPAKISDETFSECNYGAIPYVLDKGLPYKGSIKSETNIKEFLNENYKFSLDNENCSKDGIKGDYIKVNIPYCFNKMATELEHYRGDVWYEKEFEIKKYEDKPVVRLNFLGSFLVTEVWIDGEFIGVNSEGYLPFRFDISNLSEGKHKLVVKINNQTSTSTIPIKLFENHRPGWHHYSGLHKEVYLEYLPKVSVFKLKCIPKKQGDEWVVKTSLLLERAECEKEEKVNCKLSIVSDNTNGIIGRTETEVEFMQGEKVSGKTLDIEAKNPQLWDDKHPDLYKMFLETEYEHSFVDFGFREVSWGKGNIYINDKKVFLKGVCRHEDNGIKGLEKDDAITEKEYTLIKKANGNFSRLAHYPHSHSSVELADKMGLYIWKEVPFYQAGHAITHDLVGKEFGYIKLNLNPKKLINNLKKTALVKDKTLLKKTAQSLIKLVERDVNNPSVITWSIGNEIWSINKGAGKVCGWLRETVRRYDTSRAVNYAAMCMPVLTKPYEASFKYMDWVCINEYYGWYYGTLKGVKSLAKALYKKYPDKPLVITETGNDTVLGRRDERYPPKDKHSEDYQRYFLQKTMKNLEYSPAFSGFAIWIFKDFPCPEYTETNPVPFYNMKGLFDKDMNEKMGYKALSELYAKKDEELKNRSSQ